MLAAALLCSLKVKLLSSLLFVALNCAVSYRAAVVLCCVILCIARRCTMVYAVTCACVPPPPVHLNVLVYLAASVLSLYAKGR